MAALINIESNHYIDPNAVESVWQDDGPSKTVWIRFKSGKAVQVGDDLSLSDLVYWINIHRREE